MIVVFSKQKTAYDVRISDVSSDVCSSDLPRLSSPSRTIDGRPFEGPRSIRASDIIAALSVIGIDVSRDWLDGFCLPGLHRFRPTNCAEGCVFRKFPDTDFGKSRTGISVNTGQ